jgi:hypothetical protein
MRSNMSKVAHTYSPTEEEPAEFESGTFRIAPPAADSAITDEQAVRLALWSAIALLARACARLERGAR